MENAPLLKVPLSAIRKSLGLEYYENKNDKHRVKVNKAFNIDWFYYVYSDQVKTPIDKYIDEDNCPNKLFGEDQLFSFFDFPL